MGGLSYCDLWIVYPAWDWGSIYTVFDILCVKITPLQEGGEVMKWYFINGDCFGWMPNWRRYVRFESYEAYVEMYMDHN